MELLIDAEMKMFKGLNTPIIFTEYVIRCIHLVTIGMMLVGFYSYVKNVQAGFIAMNMP